MKQISFDFDATYVTAYESCREFVGHRIHQQGIPVKAVAADMDLSTSHLGRKIAQAPHDSMRFTLDDLERFIEATKDASPIFYLLEKHCVDSDRIEKLEQELAELKARHARAAK